MNTRGVRTHLPIETPKTSVQELTWQVKRLSDSESPFPDSSTGDQRGRKLSKLPRLNTSFGPSTPRVVDSESITTNSAVPSTARTLVDDNPEV